MQPDLVNRFPAPSCLCKSEAWEDEPRMDGGISNPISAINNAASSALMNHDC